MTAFTNDAFQTDAFRAEAVVTDNDINPNTHTVFLPTKDITVDI